MPSLAHSFSDTVCSSPHRPCAHREGQRVGGACRRCHTEERCRESQPRGVRHLGRINVGEDKGKNIWLYGKVTMNQPYFDSIYKPLMVKLGMACYCFTVILVVWCDVVIIIMIVVIVAVIIFVAIVVIVVVLVLMCFLVVLEWMKSWLISGTNQHIQNWSAATEWRWPWNSKPKSNRKWFLNTTKSRRRKNKRRKSRTEQSDDAEGPSSDTKEDWSRPVVTATASGYSSKHFVGICLWDITRY